MDEPDNTPVDGTQTGEETASDAGSSTPTYVTADQLADFGKDLMGNFRKTMAGMMKTQQPADQKPAQPASTQEATPQVDVAAIVRAERATERAIAKHGLNERQGDMVRQLMEVQKPEDANAFIASFAKDIGAVAPGTSAPETPSKAAPNPNPTSDRGSPGMTPTMESDDIPAWKWSQDKVDKFVSEKGLRAFVDEMKQRLPRDLKGVRFHTEKPRS